MTMIRFQLVLVTIASVATSIMAPSASGSTYIGGGAANSWFDGANWGGGDYTGGDGVVPTAAGDVGANFGNIDFTFNEANPADSLYMIVGSTDGTNVFNMAGGQLTVSTDALWGTTLSNSDGATTVNHTGGTITQAGTAPTGFLIGHDAAATYNISGGSVVVQAGPGSLTVDWDLSGTPTTTSILNISGNGIVDVAAWRFGASATLNVTGGGVLIWRDHVLADLNGNVQLGGGNDVPVIAPGAVINAQAIQVGADVHFVQAPDVLIGDLNSDGFVGQDDPNIILGAWGQQVAPPGDWMVGDPSGDGFVGQDDLNDVLGGWGQGTPPDVNAMSAVPEPNSVVLAVVASAALLMLRRRK